MNRKTPMPSQIETAITGYRNQLLLGDAKALATMQSAYGQIRDTLITHLDELVKIATANSGLTEPELMRLDRVVSLLDDIEEEIGRLTGSAERFITTAQRSAAQLASQHALGMVGVQEASLVTAWNRINPEAIQSMVGRLSDGSPLRTYLDGLTTKTSTAIEKALIDGIGRGQNPQQMANALAAETDMAAWKLAQTTRTAILGSYRQASLDSYKANEDILDGWVWVASLSDRTCASCLDNHLRVFPISEQFFAAHISCRCSPAPLVKGVDFPIAETGEDWLAKQNEKAQNAILGKTGGAEYRAGDLALQDFQSLRKDAKWGDSYNAASLDQARMNAAQRERRAA